jgi:hypothetical protein
MRFANGTLSDLPLALNEAITELGDPVAQADGTLASATTQLNLLLVWASSSLAPADGTLASATGQYNDFAEVIMANELMSGQITITTAGTAVVGTDVPGYGFFIRGLEGKWRQGLLDQIATLPQGEIMSRQSTRIVTKFVPTVFSGALTYTDKVKGIESANLVLYHPMNEASGTTAVDASSQGNDGAYTGVTLGQTGIGDGETCPLFDGTNDFNNFYSAGFNADFKAFGGECTIAWWFKVSGAGVWTDSTSRYFVRLVDDGSNLFAFHKRNINNRVDLDYYAGGTMDTVAAADYTSTDWYHIAVTISATADEMKAYRNGTQLGSTQTGLGAWAGGDLLSSQVLFGASSNVPATPWDGYLAHAAIWTTPLSAADVLSLATV